MADATDESTGERHGVAADGPSAPAAAAGDAPCGRPAPRDAAPSVYPRRASCWDYACGGAPPPPCSGHTLVALNAEADDLLCFGGNGSDSEQVFNDVYRLRLDRKARRAEARLLRPCTSAAPAARDRHSAWAWRGKMYVFGGEDRVQWMCSDIWEFDPHRAEWRELHPAGTLPTPRRGQTGTLVGDSAWIFGGLTYEQQSVSELYELDMATQCMQLCECGGPTPPGRRGHAAAERSGFLYVFGGCGAQEELLGDLWRLDLRTCVWREVCSQQAEPQRAPAPRAGHAAALWRDHLIILGGNARAPAVGAADVWLWDFQSGRWLRLDANTTLRPRSYHAVAAAPAQGAIVFYAGWLCDGDSDCSLADLVELTGWSGTLKQAAAHWLIENQVPYTSADGGPAATPRQPQRGQRS
eukprot:TRINITY_DN26841_c0_g1_i1.p1 TRINITY_DN26841_c0_g1~~TRINITY_DN26841_c0_g1_i1.p1  ORF type:complete len:438 (+),score=88.21 TRINITY_DN26841_c0_g1_i1:83-1315(+)